MNNVRSVNELKKVVDLKEHHSLTVSRSHREIRGTTVFETQWLEERNENQTLVSRFRIWTNQSNKPPYRKQMGWEQFSVNGALLDREIRYFKRDDNEWLH